MAKSDASTNEGKKGGRPPRDLFKCTIATDATAFALLEKTRLDLTITRTQALEDAFREYAAKRGFTITPEEVAELLKRPLPQVEEQQEQELQAA